MLLRISSSFIAKAVAAAALVVASPAVAQPAADTTRRTAPQSDLPLIPTRPLKFTTDEGTWMSLDVSPDGRTIVFDLVGDLYTMPVGGGGDLGLGRPAVTVLSRRAYSLKTPGRVTPRVTLKVTSLAVPDSARAIELSQSVIGSRIGDYAFTDSYGQPRRLGCGLRRASSPGGRTGLHRPPAARGRRHPGPAAGQYRTGRSAAGSLGCRDPVDAVRAWPAARQPA